MCLVCWRRDRLPSPVVWSLVAQLVKNPPAMWETWVQSLGWKIPWRRERPPTSIFWPGEFHGWYSAWGRRVGHDWVTFTSLLILYVLSLSVQLFVTPWTVARQAPLSMGILQARILEWVAIPPPRDLPNPGIEPRFPALQADSLLSEPPGKPKNTGVGNLSMLQVVFLTQELNQVSCIAGGFFASWSTREAPLNCMAFQESDSEVCECTCLWLTCSKLIIYVAFLYRLAVSRLSSLLSTQHCFKECKNTPKINIPCCCCC